MQEFTPETVLLILFYLLGGLSFTSLAVSFAVQIVGKCAKTRKDMKEFTLLINQLTAELDKLSEHPESAIAEMAVALRASLR